MERVARHLSGELTIGRLQRRRGLGRGLVSTAASEESVPFRTLGFYFTVLGSLYVRKEYKCDLICSLLRLCSFGDIHPFVVCTQTKFTATIFRK